MGVGVCYHSRAEKQPIKSVTMTARFDDDVILDVGATPPGRDLPLPKVRQIQRNIALQLLQVGEQVVLVSGMAGIGKTALLQSLAWHSNGLRMRRVAASAGLDAGVLLAILEEVRAESPQRLRVADSQEVQTALLIDDAARLQDETLAALLAAWKQARQEGDGFGLLLSAEPGFKQRLEALGDLSPDQLYELKLQPFTADQTLEYLDLRLSGAEILLAERKLRAIHERSRGVPARIERELELLLSGGGRRWSLPQLKLPRLGLPAGGRRAALVVSVILTVLAIVLVAALQYAERQATRSPAAIVQRGETTTRLELPPPQRPAPVAPAADQAAAPVPQEQAVPQEPQPWNDEPEVVAAAAEGLATEPEVQGPQPEAPAASASEPPASVVAAAPAPPPASAGSAETPLRGNAWLRRQNPDRFTIQLIGASDRAALSRYIREHGLVDRAALLTVELNRRDWHVVVLGDYPSRAAGRAALQRLPAELREAGAWVRSFGELQQIARD